MTSPEINIILIEPSHLICHGLKSVAANSGRNLQFFQADSLSELQHQLVHRSPDLIIINPSIPLMDGKTFQVIRNEYPDIKWVGMVYSLFDQQLLSTFDGIISVNDFPHTIINTIQQVISQPKSLESVTESLSDRETEVLKLLVTGLASKEIADKLNISTHTVITHRKNISLKTGIKSVSGLTIYAVVKGIMKLDQFPV